MLINPGFEADWSEEESHQCLVVPKGGAPYKADIGNIFTPPGWLTFFYHEEGVYAQPEVRDARAEQDARRAYGGEGKGMLLFTFSRKHVAGFMQQVQVEPGTRLRLSAWAHAWSNHIDGPHTDNAYWSEGPGWAPCNEAKQYVGARNWHLQGDAPNSDWANFVFKLGYDATGGTHPFEGTIWGQGIHIYNAYTRQVPYVEFVAESDTVTIFLRSVTRWAFKHNDAYWDNVVLEVVDEQPPPPGECRGRPRVQYPRTNILLPPDSGWLWPTALADLVSEYRVGILHSADDAGIGDLDVRNVVAVNPHLWDNDLEDFFNVHYPEVEYYPATADLEHIEYTVAEILEDIAEPPPPPPPSDDIALSQCDPEWGNQSFGEPGCTGTFCSDGCYMTCLAMALRFYEMDEDATPVTVNEALLPDGFSDTSPCRPLWTAIEDKLGLAVSSPSNVDDELASGLCAMAEVQPPELEHFVLVTEKVDGLYHMYDPLSGEKGILENSYVGVESWRLLVPVEEPPPLPLEETRVGLHLQTGNDGVWPFYATTKSRMLKVLFGYEMWADLYSHSPNTIFVIRHWTAHPGQYLWHPDGVEAGAEAFVDNFRPTLEAIAMASPNPIYAESLNEEYSHSEEHVIQSVAFDKAYIDVISTIPNARAVVFCAPVGNPHESQFQLLVPLARKAREYGAAMGYHCYWGANPNNTYLKSWWPWLAGRWTEIQKVFEANGIYGTRWLMGEGGGVGAYVHADLTDAQRSAIEALIEAQGTSRIAHAQADLQGLFGGQKVQIVTRTNSMLSSSTHLTAADVASQSIILLPNSGWRNGDCYDGNWSRYQGDIELFQSLIQGYDAAMTLFTTAAPGMGWQSFQIGQAEMQKLSTVL